MKYTEQFSTVQNRTVQYSTVQYSTVQYSTAQYSTEQCSTDQIRTEQNRTKQNRTKQNKTEHDRIFHLVDENSAIFGCILYCSFRRLGCIPPVIKTGIEKSRICVNQFVLVYQFMFVKK